MDYRGMYTDDNNGTISICNNSIMLLFLIVAWTTWSVHEYYWLQGKQVALSDEVLVENNTSVSNQLEIERIWFNPDITEHYKRINGF